MNFPFRGGGPLFSSVPIVEWSPESRPSALSGASHPTQQPRSRWTRAGGGESAELQNRKDGHAQMDGRAQEIMIICGCMKELSNTS